MFVTIRRLHLVYKRSPSYLVVGVKMLNRWANADRKLKGYTNDGVFQTQDWCWGRKYNLINQGNLVQTWLTSGTRWQLSYEVKLNTRNGCQQSLLKSPAWFLLFFKYLHRTQRQELKPQFRTVHKHNFRKFKAISPCFVD